MFDQLLDPNPPDFGDGFKRRVVAAGRRRQRRVRTAAGSAVLAPIVAVSGVAMYVRTQSDQLERISVDGLVPAGPPASTTPIGGSFPPDSVEEQRPVPPIAVPINVLVAGVDRRPTGSEVTGARADTVALVRIDPDQERVSVLSLPRDLWVTTDDGTEARLNSFVDDGALVSVVSSLLDVDINHYVEIDFEGFRSLIDIAGGVDVPFDAAVRDIQTGFAADAGCEVLTGDEALAYVRSRKLETFDPTTNTWTRDATGDLGRIARQQDVMRRFYRTVLTQDYDPADRVRLLNDVVDDITVDVGLDLDGVRAIFNAAALIGADGFVTVDVSDSVTGTVIDGNSVLVVEPGGLELAVDEFLGRGGDPAAADATDAAIDDRSDTSSTC